MTSPPTTHAAHEWARTISVALLPVVAVIVGGMFSFAGTEREQQTKMIELATSVLQTPPTPESGPIRDWAIRVIDRYSEEKFTMEAKGLLRDSVPIFTGELEPICFDSAGRIVLEPRARGQRDSLGRPLFRCVR